MSTPDEPTDDNSATPVDNGNTRNGPDAGSNPGSSPSDRTWLVAVTVGAVVGFLAFTGALAGGIIASYAPSYNSPDPVATQEEPGDPGDPGAPEPAPVDPMPQPPMPEPPVATIPPPGWDDTPRWDESGEDPYGYQTPDPSDFADASNPAAYVAAAREINAAQEDVNIVTMALDDIGFDYRIVAIDGEYLPVTQDFSDTRLNLEVVNGIVVAASVG